MKCLPSYLTIILINLLNILHQKVLNIFVIFIPKCSILLKLPSDLLIPFRSTFSKWIFKKNESFSELFT